MHVLFAPVVVARISVYRVFSLEDGVCDQSAYVLVVKPIEDPCALLPA